MLPATRRSGAPRWSAGRTTRAAKHDDHHLATIWDLLQTCRNATW